MKIIFLVVLHFPHIGNRSAASTRRKNNVIATLFLRCIYTSENFPRNGKFSADRMRSTIFSKEKIVLRMRSAENFPFRGKFSEVYMHLNVLFSLGSASESSFCYF